MTARTRSIHQAALALFAERGYQATTMEDIGIAVGIRGPSLYKHVGSKQAILVSVMTSTMDTLLANHAAAVHGCEDVAERLRRAVEAHVRFHVRHRLEAFVGTREIRSLDDPDRGHIVDLRSRYEHQFRNLITDGMDEGRFRVASAKLASFAILDLGMGASVWFREGSDLTEDEVVFQYGDFALKLVASSPGPRGM
jgi:AcrR family transcriptional regulator